MITNKRVQIELLCAVIERQELINFPYYCIVPTEKAIVQWKQ